MQRILGWLYRRTGRRYPTAFLAIELQSAYLIALGSLALLAQFYDVGAGDFGKLVALVLGVQVIAVTGGIVRGHRRLTPLRAWIAGDRDPSSTVRAWQTAVGAPLDMLRDMPIAVFVFALPACVISVVVLDLPWSSFIPITAGGLIATGYAAVLHYFAIESGLRPVVVDINRSLPTQFEVGRAAFPLAVKLIGSLPLINIITGLVVAGITGASLGLGVLAAVAVAFTISFELTLLLSKSLLRPIADLRRATARVNAGDYEVTVPITTGDELGELSAAFNEMTAGLAERERIREAFGTYLDKDVAEYILASEEVPRGINAVVSILFCDVQGFTRFASDHEAPEVVDALNSLFEQLVPVVGRHGGHIDKFVGDGLLAVFGVPERHADHADRAVAAAVEMARCVNHERDGLRIGVGVNSGRALAGTIGGGGRLNFSVIGDVVNVASRVESATRETGDDVLITAATRALLTRDLPLEPRGSVELKGKDQPLELYAALVQDAAAVAEPPQDGAAQPLSARLRQ